VAEWLFRTSRVRIFIYVINFKPLGAVNGNVTSAYSSHSGA